MHTEFFRLRPCERNQFLDIFHRQRRMHGENAGRIRQPRHRLKIAQHMIRQLAVQGLVHGVRAHAAHHQRVAVRRCACREFGTDNAPRAAAIVDDHLLSKRGAERPSEDARTKIDKSARRKSRDHAHGFYRISLRRKSVIDVRHTDDHGDQLQYCVATCHNDALPW